MTRYAQTLTTLLVVTAFFGPTISYGKVYSYHLAMLFLLIYYLLHPNIFKDLIKFNLQTNRIWFIILGYSFLSLTWAPNLNDGMKYIGYMLCGTFLLFTVPFHFKDRSPIKILSYFYLAHLVLALLEIYTSVRWPISGYSKIVEFFAISVGPSPDYFDKYPTSFFWHQNNCALVTLVALPFLFKIKDLMFKLALLIGSFLVIIGSGSKAIIILSIIYAIVKIALSFRRNWSFRRFMVVMTLGLGVILLAFFSLNQMQRQEFLQSSEVVQKYVFLLPKFFYAKMTGQSFEFVDLNENIGERYRLMSTAIDLLKTSPLLGIGAGGHLNQVQSIHNYWLEILVVFGPFIFVLYIWWLVSLLIKRTVYSEALLLFIIGAPVLSSAIYFLPKWLLYALCLCEKDDPTKS